MALNIVLIEPEIPTNTGNIGRLSLAAGANLHLVKPLGFEITDKRLKRAGLDYWKHLSLTTYESINEFFEVNQDKDMAFFSSHATKSIWSLEYRSDMFLVFGKESVGLPKNILNEHESKLYKIPILNDQIRSLNLANAVGIVVYEGIRSLSVQ